jgi:hypothetical protein
LFSNCDTRPTFVSQPSLCYARDMSLWIGPFDMSLFHKKVYFDENHRHFCAEASITDYHLT